MRALSWILVSGWVLWINSGHGDEFTLNQGLWAVYDGYESRSDCNKARTTLMQKALKELGGAWKADDIFISSKDGSQTLKYKFHCLPAELDPRPPSQ